MNLENRQIWQIAAGDTDRHYADMCLRFGIVVIGPGRYGHMTGTVNAVAEMRKEGISSRQITMLQQFAAEIKEGDIAVLRIGRSEVHGVGIIRGKYSWSPTLMDVDGWDICHYWPVEWVWKSDGKPKLFQNALNFGNTLQRLTQSPTTDALFSWLSELPESREGYAISDLPPAGRPLSIDALCQPLYDYGISLNNLSGLKDCISQLQALAKWYGTYSNRPSEHETVTHLVVPLLLALGWTPQRIALEYHQTGIGRADVALYEYGNRQDEYLTAIVEAKKFGRSCLRAESQVRSYVAEPINRLIVTDGIRYGIFCKDENNRFPDHPTAYLNLADPRDGYPIYGDNCAGADEALWLMNADWRHNLPKPGIVGKDIAA